MSSLFGTSFLGTTLKDSIGIVGKKPPTCRGPRAPVETQGFSPHRSVGEPAARPCRLGIILSFFFFVKCFIKSFCPRWNFLFYIVKKNKRFVVVVGGGDSGGGGGEELFSEPSPFLEGKHFDQQIRKLPEVTVTSSLFGTLLTCE